ncbi:MAG: 23S rRNA (guanosine(2251)-2'-O)-methyltransferase RlmB [Alphaproteobacteria bacterium]|nr:23S rRNA (guanosine(2251)-2'-O)-methyltransferase RlmB [Alphaproteobacteria bacterium]
MKKKDNPNSYWLFGFHSVKAALENPHRHCRKIVTANQNTSLLETLKPLLHKKSLTLEISDSSFFRDHFPEQNIHQKIALLVDPLSELSLEDFLDSTQNNVQQTLVILDHVTDPQNVGAILRSAAALGADAVIITSRHSPTQGSILAKVASGALDIIPLITVVNIGRSLEYLKKNGFWCLGFAAEASTSLLNFKRTNKIALILGSEGEGLRRLTKEKCDFLVHLPTKPHMPHLNVANSAAIALYQTICHSSHFKTINE